MVSTDVVSDLPVALANLSRAPTRSWRKRPNGVELICAWGDHRAASFLLVVENDGGHGLGNEEHRTKDRWSWAIIQLHGAVSSGVSLPWRRACAFGISKRSDAQRDAVETLTKIVRGDLALGAA